MSSLRPALVVIVLLVASPVRAQPVAPPTAGASAAGDAQPQIAAQPGLGTSTTDVFTGAFVHAIPIEVPPFRGEEPHLSLAYHSGDGNGAVGVGWSLLGASEVVRAGPARGTPTFTSADLFFLDGMELVPCTASTVSPSCQYGGNYATKTESYERVKFDGRSWTVTARDGSVSVYAPVTSQFPTAQWGLASRTTARGTIYFTWGSCPSFTAAPARCYLTDVTYGPARVHLYVESRPDWQSAATGDPALLFSPFRYAAIDVQIAGVRVRTYELGYAPSPDIGVSQLTTVQQYGKDAVLAPSGKVLSGTPSPAAMTATYTSSSPIFYTPFAGPIADVVAGACVNNRTAWCASGRDARVVGDFNGDGRADILVRDVGPNLFTPGPNDGAILLGTGTLGAPQGFTVLWTQPAPATPTAWTQGPSNTAAGLSFGGWAAASDDAITPGDFDGDGATDLLLRSADGTRAAIAWGIHGATQTVLTAPQLLWQSGGPALYGIGATDSLIPGDFNGDGKTDLLVQAPSGALTLLVGGSRVAPFTATAFGNGCYQSWCLHGADRFHVGDFNGDGKSDLFVDNGAPAHWDGTTLVEDPLYRSVWTATGNPAAPFTVVMLWTPAGGGEIAQRSYNGWTAHFADEVYLGDFNGDGKTDLVLDNSGAVFNTPKIFGADGPDFLPWCTIGPTTCGPTAVVMYGTGNSAAPFATGSSLWAPPAGASQLTGSGYGLDIGIDWSASHLAVGDFNGDRISDLVVRATPTGTSTAAGYLLEGTGNPWAPFHMRTGGGVIGSDAMADVNGDGITDSIGASGQTLTSINALAGLLATVANGLGGSTTVGYVPSTRWANTNLPFVVPTVQTLDVADGRGTVGRTTFTYAAGLYDRAERRFLGFGRVKEETPCIAAGVCPYVETTFAQDYGALAQPLVVTSGLDVHTHLGYADDVATVTPYHETHHLYQTNDATPPYTSLETTTYAIDYDNTGTSCASFPCATAIETEQTFGHDGFGNVIWTWDLGDVGTSGDERYVQTAFYPNTSAYIVALPAQTWEWDATTWAPLRFTQQLYDSAATATTPPTRGLQTGTVRWLDSPSSSITTSTSYDDYGNVSMVVNELGYRTQYTYDPVFHLYPTGALDAVGHATVTVYDPICNVPVTSTDANQQTTTVATDALCRPQRITDPAGTFTQFAYCANISANACGNANQQYVDVETPSADGNGNQWTHNYFDGQGRVWRSVTKGPTPGQPITTDIAFDARGRIAARSVPYYPGDAVISTTFAYDGRDRLTRTAAGDGTAVTRAYVLTPCPTTGTCYATTVTDQLGHPTTSVSDARGRVLRRTDNRGSTTFAYDQRDARIGVTDAAGNAWHYTVDSLGRDTATSDPDLGGWSYAWDATGALSRKTDAKGVTTYYFYDGLGRPIEWYAYDTTTGYYDYSEWIYDEQRPGRSNVGHATTMYYGTSNASGSTYGTQTWDYDAAGREVATTRTINGTPYTMTRGYDAGGRLAWSQYPDGDTAGTPAQPLRYDGAGREVQLPGIVDAATYDAAGHLLTRQGSNCTLARRQYSPTRGWITELATTKECSGTAATTLQQLDYARDAEGKPVTLARAGANPWIYFYDSADRMYYAYSPNAAGYNGSYYGFDNVDNITSQYRETNGAWTYLGYTYPLPGQPRPHAATTIAGASYQYDANGNATLAPMHATAADGTVTTSAPQVITHDTQGRILAIGGSTYRYDGANERLAQGGTTYVGREVEIDASGQMTKYFTFAGERVAKRVGSASTPPLTNVQIIGLQSAKCADIWQASTSDQAPLAQYDCLGAAHLNQIFQLTPSNGGYQILSVNSNKCLDVPWASTADGVQVQQYSCNGQTNQAWRLVPSATGAYQIVSVNSGKCLDVTAFSTASGAALQQWSCSGAPNQAFRIVAPSAPVNAAGTYWLHTDQLGSVTLETNASGDPTVYGPAQDYLPFGAPVSAPKPEAFAFTGERQDAATGLLFLHARYYDPYIARFLAADDASPADPAVGVNRYAYALNNPVSNVDHTGHRTNTPLSVRSDNADMLSYGQMAPDGLFIFDSHSDGVHYYGGTADSPEELTISGVAQTIQADTTFQVQHQALLTDGCYSGLSPHGPASQLAAEMHVYVVAPIDLGWAGATGLASAREVVRADGTKGPDTQLGRWTVFDPSGARVVTFQSPVGGIGKDFNPVLARVANLQKMYKAGENTAAAEADLRSYVEIYDWQQLAIESDTPSRDALLPPGLPDPGQSFGQGAGGFGFGDGDFGDFEIPTGGFDGVGEGGEAAI